MSQVKEMLAGRLDTIRIEELKGMFPSGLSNQKIVEELVEFYLVNARLVTDVTNVTDIPESIPQSIPENNVITREEVQDMIDEAMERFQSYLE